MKTIRVEFRKFQELSLHEAAGETGCYVIWDSHSKAKATYIGAGNVLKRISEHHGKFSLPLDGYVAITNDDVEARILEALLIDLARDTDRGPSQNERPGDWIVLKRYCKSEKLKVYISGFDPLRPVAANQELKQAKVIEVLLGEDDELTYYTIDWKARRKIAA